MGGISIWQILIILIFVGAIYGIYRFAKNPPPAQSSSEGPAGVAGWLLLLVVGLIFLGPLMGAGRINADIVLVEYQYPNLKDIKSWQLYKSATWWSFLVVACLSIYAGFGLAKGRNPSVVKRAKILLWVAGPAASIVMGIFLPLFVFGELESIPQLLGALVGSVLAAAIWTAYLSNSRRVKATYFPLELENKSGKGNKVNLSKDVTASFSGFTNHIEKENKKRKYPRFLKHLSTTKGRLAYSFLPFFLLLLALFAEKGARLFSNIQRDLDEFLAIAIAWYVGSFVAFTVLHWGITKVSKYWNVRKDLRLWIFGSGFWIIGVLLYVIIIDPYNNGSWKYMDDDEYFHMFLVMLIPPLFIGSAKHAYEKYIE